MSVRFFPHEVTDLSMLLSYINLKTDDLHETSNRWSLRYVILLWLSLVSVIPFDLAQLDEPGNVGKTAHDIEEFGKKNLNKAGLERDSAAVLLSRVYMR
jgi:tubulin-specific chaperone D